MVSSKVIDVDVVSNHKIIVNSTQTNTDMFCH